MGGRCRRGGTLALLLVLGMTLGRTAYSEKATLSMANKQISTLRLPVDGIVTELPCRPAAVPLLKKQIAGVDRVFADADHRTAVPSESGRQLTCFTESALSMGRVSKTQPSDEVSQASKPADFSTDIYYRNKLEFSLQTGVLPINIPFVFDAFVGGDYSQRPLHYTLVPIFPSLRWQIDSVKGPGILRGNTDVTATLSITAIPRGPETHYEAFDLGLRRNFVQRNWKIAPYSELRLGAGFIDAKGPTGVAYAQGQDFTFTLMLNGGLRYNFDSRYSMEVGAAYMHVSNAYLSEPKYVDHGINVCGPVVGFNVRLGRPRRRAER